MTMQHHDKRASRQVRRPFRLFRGGPMVDEIVDERAGSAGHHVREETILPFLLFAAAAFGLYASSLYTYLLFHTLVEIFCVFVMLSVFVLSWNSPRLLDSHYFLFLAISFLSSGSLELLHIFAYKGFGVFPEHDANLPTQLWIAFRYVFSLSFLAAPVFISRRFNPAAMLIAFAVVTALLISAIFSGNFPDCFIEGRGLTSFKVFSEYLIIVILLAAGGFLISKRTHFDPRVLRTLIVSVVIAIAAEAAFTQYLNVYGPANLVGHLCLFLSTFLIYKAIVVTGIKEPAALLFRNLDRSKEALKASEQRLRNQVELMNQTHEPLIMREMGGVILFWNRGAEALYGWPAVEAIGRRMHDLLHTEGAPPEHKDAQLSETGRWVGELIHTTRDGSRVTVESRQTAIHAPDGSLLALESNRDITEYRLAEEALQQAHNQLANQMEERTGELREKEVLLKEIHHRVKNNLQIISSLVSLQADSAEDETTREGLRDVMNRVRSMALVHEKLYQSTDLARIDFAEYIRSLLNYLWRAQANIAATVGLTLELEPLALPVDIAMPCGLILNELAGNALKHAFRGRTEGKVTVALDGTGDRTVRLFVRDNGIGLPPELDWRQSSSLGLRLVQMLANQLHAAVELIRNNGTEFQITFKLPDAATGRELKHG